MFGMPLNSVIQQMSAYWSIVLGAEVTNGFLFNIPSTKTGLNQCLPPSNLCAENTKLVKMET